VAPLPIIDILVPPQIFVEDGTTVTVGETATANVVVGKFGIELPAKPAVAPKVVPKHELEGLFTVPAAPGVGR